MSLTVTEGGYFLNADGYFDPTHDAIRADAATPDAPHTVFGIILKALKARRAHGIAPFTVMSCDNLLHNGKRTRGTVTGLARLADPALAEWVIAAVLERIQQAEVIPGVTPVPEMDPTRYFDVVRTRFSNPNIADTISRLCYDGGNRQPKFIVPAIRHALDVDVPVAGLALASALWCRYCAGTRDDGTPIAANDPQWDRLNRTALAARATPMLWLEQQDIYGSVGQEARFRTAFADALDALYRDGVPATLAAFANGA